MVWPEVFCKWYCSGSVLFKRSVSGVSEAKRFRVSSGSEEGSAEHRSLANDTIHHHHVARHARPADLKAFEEDDSDEIGDGADAASEVDAASFEGVATVDANVSVDRTASNESKRETVDVVSPDAEAPNEEASDANATESEAANAFGQDVSDEHLEEAAPTDAAADDTDDAAADAASGAADDAVGGVATDVAADAARGAAVDADAPAAAEEPATEGEPPVGGQAATWPAPAAQDAAPQQYELVMPGALEDDPDIGDESTSAEGYDGPSEGLQKLAQNRMAPVVGQRRSSDVRWQDVHPRTPGKKRELKHTRGWFQAVVVCIVMAVIVGVVIAGVTYHLELWGGKTVPSVVGLVSSNAQAKLSQKGLNAQIAYVASDDGNDRVISVDPGAGSRVDDGATVTLTVGQSRMVPTVVGTNVQDARQALSDAGATNVKLTYTNSSEAEGTVLSVTPSEGATFVSSDLITLTVAQLPVVPDVVGRSSADALKVLQDAGLTPTVVYSSEGSHQKGYVESTTPSAGSRADAQGSVKVTVMSPLPADVYHVADYYSALPQALSYFLTQKGYSVAVGYTDGAGKLAERLDSTDGSTVLVSSAPWSASVDQGSSAVTDLLGQGSAMDGLGVRLSLGAATAPQLGATVGAVDRVIQLCGLSGGTETVNQQNATLPSNSAARGKEFYCTYGESGDNAWCVLAYVNDQKKTQAEVVYAPKALFDAVDASAEGGSKASFVANALLG